MYSQLFVARPNVCGGRVLPLLCDGDCTNSNFELDCISALECE